MNMADLQSLSRTDENGGISTSGTLPSEPRLDPFGSSHAKSSATNPDVDDGVSQMQIVRRGLFETAGAPIKPLKTGNPPKRKPSPISRPKSTPSTPSIGIPSKSPTRPSTRDPSTLANIYFKDRTPGIHDIQPVLNSKLKKPGKSVAGNFSPSALGRAGFSSTSGSRKPSTAPADMSRRVAARSPSPSSSAVFSTTAKSLVSTSGAIGDLYQRNSMLLHDENERLMNRIREFEEETQKLSKELRRKDDEVSAYKGKLTRLNAQHQSQTALFGKIQEENAELKLTRGRLVQKLKVEEEKVVRAKRGGDVNDVKTAEALTKAAMLQGRAAALEETLRQVKETHDTKEQMSSKMKERNELLKKKVRDLEVEVLRAQREVKNRDDLMVRLNGVVIDLQEKLLGYEREHSNFQNKLGTLSKDLSTTGGETVQALIQRLKEEEATTLQHMQKNKELSDSLANEKSKLAKIESELRKTKKALEASLNETTILKNRSALERRPASRTGAAASVSPTKQKSTTASSIPSFSEIEVAEKIRLATAMQSAHVEELRASIRDLEKQISVEISLRTRAESQSKSLSDQTKDLKTKLSETTQTLLKEKEEHKSLNSQIKKLTGVSEGQVEQIAKLKREVESLSNAKIDDARQQDIQSKMRSELEKEAYERQKLVELNKQTNDSLRRSEEKYRELFSELASVKKDLDLSAKAVQKLTMDNERFAAKCRTLEESLKTKDSDHKREVEDLQRLTREMQLGFADKEKEYKAQLAALQQPPPESPSTKSLDKERESRKKAEQALKESNEMMEGLRKEIQSLEERLETIEKLKFDLQSKLRKAQNDLDSTQTELSALKSSQTAARVSELEERCKSLSEANEQLLKRLERDGK